MNFSDMIFWGWLRIINNTVYLYDKEEGSPIVPREHSFFISFLFHDMNLWSALRFLFAKYLSTTVPLALSLTVSVLVFAAGYIIYFRQKRISKVTFYKPKTFVASLTVIASIAYAVVSVYLTFLAGNYVRDQVAQ